MEGPDVLLPYFMEIASKSMSIGDIAALAETNKTWSDWVESHLDSLADEYTLPYAKSIKQLVDYSWLSQNKLLKIACKKGNMEAVKSCLEKDACQITKAGYYAAKHGHIEVVQLLRELGADDAELIRGAIRGDQLDVLKTFDTSDIHRSKELYKYAHTTKTTRVRDWLLENGYNISFPILVLNPLLNQEEQKIIKLPDYMIYYGLFVVNDKLKKAYPGDYDVNGAESYKIKNSYKILLYIFAKFNFPGISQYLEKMKYESFSVRTLKYCFSHNKHVDLMLRTYGYMKETIFDIALRCERFHITDVLVSDSQILRNFFHSSNDVMKYAIKSHRIFAYMESRPEIGRLPILNGLTQAIERDRPKMFRFLFEKLGNSPEVFRMVTQNYQFIKGTKPSIECIKICKEIFDELLSFDSGNILPIIDSMMYEKTDLPFFRYLGLMISKAELKYITSYSKFYDKVMMYLME